MYRAENGLAIHITRNFRCLHLANDVVICLYYWKRGKIKTAVIITLYVVKVNHASHSAHMPHGFQAVKID